MPALLVLVCSWSRRCRDSLFTGSARYCSLAALRPTPIDVKGKQ